jgi:hypothetical protein
MKQLLICLALATSSAWGASSQIVSPPVAAVTVYTDFEQAAPQGVAEILEAEVESIMAPAGFRFEWRPLSDFRSDTVSAAVVVAHFEARCDVDGLVMRGNQPGPLGWTGISDGTILPFTHVDCGRVRTFLQSTLLGYHPKDRESIYGRALGRVLAHELYHVFAATAEHAACGIAKEEYSVRDLVAAHFQLHEKQTMALRTSRVMAALQAAAVPGVASSM